MKQKNLTSEEIEDLIQLKESEQETRKNLYHQSLARRLWRRIGNGKFEPLGGGEIRVVIWVNPFREITQLRLANYLADYSLELEDWNTTEITLSVRVKIR